MTFSLVFDLWYPGNAAMTSSGDPSSVGYHPLPSACNTNPRACLPAPVRFTTTVNPLLQISLAIPPSKRALTPLALYRVCSNNERKRKKEGSLRRDMGSMGSIFLSTLSLSCSRGEREKKIRVFFFERRKEKLSVPLCLIDGEEYRSAAYSLRGYGTIFDIDCFHFRL